MDPTILALGCQALTIARRQQEAIKSMIDIARNAPPGTFSPDEHRGFDQRMADAQQGVASALDKLIALTGSRAVGEQVLARTNALLRAERAASLARYTVEQAVFALRCAAAEALEEEAKSLTVEIDTAADEETRGGLTAQLHRTAAVVEQLRTGNHFEDLGGLA